MNTTEPTTLLLVLYSHEGCSFPVEYLSRVNQAFLTSRIVLSYAIKCFFVIYKKKGLGFICIAGSVSVLIIKIAFLVSVYKRHTLFLSSFHSNFDTKSIHKNPDYKFNYVTDCVVEFAFIFTWLLWLLGR